MKNPYFILAICFLLSGNILRAQTPAWDWAISENCATAVGSAYVNNTTTDAAGNVYVTGAFTSNLMAFGTDTLTGSLANGGYFFAKYNPHGELLWVQGSATPVWRNYMYVSADALGNIFVTGDYLDTVVLGSTILTYPGTTNYMAKYDVNGNLIWAQNAGGVVVNVQSVSADGLGNAYITGISSNFPLVFGTDTLTDTSTVGAFIVKYDAAGNIKWAKIVNRTGRPASSLITTDAVGDVYLSGNFNGNYLILGSDSLINQSISADASLFVAKFDTSGNQLWAIATGGYSFATVSPSGNAIDPSGNLFITGQYSGTAVFGADTFANPSNGISAYTIKFDKSGNQLWARAGISQGYTNDVGAQGIAIAADGAGNALVTGTYNNLGVVFGDDTIYNYAQTSNLFVLKYDANGNLLWTISPVTADEAGSSAISINSVGNIFVSGSFDQNIVFGSDTEVSPFVTSNFNTYSIFLASLGGISGIAQVANAANSILVYPNPSSGNFLFAGVNADDVIQVYTLVGQQVYSGIAADKYSQVNLGQKAKGIYFYRVIHENNSITEGKIVLQ